MAQYICKKKMVGTLYKGRKGVYSLITLYMLIIICVFVVVSLILVNTQLFGLKRVSRDVYKEELLLRSVRDRVLFCYGQVISDSAPQDCMSPQELATAGIRGIKLLNIRLVEPGK